MFHPFSGSAGFYEAFYARVKGVFIALWLLSRVATCFWDKCGLESHQFGDLKHGVTLHSFELTGERLAMSACPGSFGSRGVTRVRGKLPFACIFVHETCLFSDKRNAHAVILQATFCHITLSGLRDLTLESSSERRLSERVRVWPT